MEADASTAVQALTPQALEEFEQIWRRRNPNKDISEEQLRDEALRVLKAVTLTYRPILAQRKESIE